MFPTLILGSLRHQRGHALLLLAQRRTVSIFLSRAFSSLSSSLSIRAGCTVGRRSGPTHRGPEFFFLSLRAWAGAGFELITDRSVIYSMWVAGGHLFLFFFLDH